MREETQNEREKEERECERRVRVSGEVYWFVGMNPDEKEWTNERVTRRIGKVGSLIMRSEREKERGVILLGMKWNASSFLLRVIDNNRTKIN